MTDISGGRIGWGLGTQCPTGHEWLGPREAEVYQRLRMPKRRREWLLGRWAAKRALLAAGQVSGDLSQIEILAAADGAPEAWAGAAPVATTISISHRAGLALAAVAAPELALGCDLELIEPRSERFVRDYFTADEQALLAEAPADARPMRTMLMWSAKEAALKAVRTGLRRDTRSMAVSWPSETESAKAMAADAATQRDCKSSGDWRAVTVHDLLSERCFRGCWRVHDEHLITVVAALPANEPLTLVELATSGPGSG